MARVFPRVPEQRVSDQPSAPDHYVALERVEIDAWREIVGAASPPLATDLGLAVQTVGGATVVITRAVGVLECNRAIGLGVTSPATEEGIDAIVDAFRAGGASRFCVQLHPDAQPADLARRLEARGITHHDNWIRLHRRTDPAPDLPAGLRVEEIDQDRAAVFAYIVSTGFGWDRRLGALVAAPIGDPGWHHYLAYEGATPVAAAGQRVSGEYAWFGFAATLPASRGRGGQSSLLARRIHDARAMGCRWVSIETDEQRPDHPAPSYRNVRRAGFTVAHLRPNYLGTAADLG
jgi:GNAT superfamily N-acetyltransferase